MIRFVAGVVSALLLVAAGFFVWNGLAKPGASPLPAAPPAARLAVAEADPAAPAPVLAPPPEATEQTREEKRFARYDRNKDGVVDRDEYLANRRKAFARLDTNGDGKLSFDEYSAKTETKFAAADADHSGKLDPTEFATTRVVRKAKAPCPKVAAPAPAAADDES